MKHDLATLLALFTLVCINFSIGTSAGSVSSIQWYTYDQGLILAKEQNKPMMIDFTSKWCSWCDKLDEDTFSNFDVAGLAEGFICIKVDVDEDDAIANRFQIEGLPTVVFADPQEVEIHRVVGYKDSDGFMGDMNFTLEKLAGQDPSSPVPDSVDSNTESKIPGFEAAMMFVGIIVAFLFIRRQYA